ncbi:hypothetical protein HAX54_030529, partial [Datura stramonium]|nr:hypothetical protein [Datura stramonium]
MDEAFRAVFGKEQPGRIRCHGISIYLDLSAPNQPSPVDYTSSQGLRDHNLPHTSRSTHGPILEE